MNEFFQNQWNQSELKSIFIEKYFNAWAKIMNKKSNEDKLLYIDLFSGPGSYKDGKESTPVKITKLILNNEDFKNKVQLLFNDKKQEYVDNLKEVLSNLNGFDELKYEPIFNCSEINEEVKDFFITKNLYPVFVKQVVAFTYNLISLTLCSNISLTSASLMGLRVTYSGNDQSLILPDHLSGFLNFAAS